MSCARCFYSLVFRPSMFAQLFLGTSVVRDTPEFSVKDEVRGKPKLIVALLFFFSIRLNAMRT